VESEPSKGSTFFFTIPNVAEEHSAKSVAPVTTSIIKSTIVGVD
jgi:hypothetical protein